MDLRKILFLFLFFAGLVRWIVLLKIVSEQSSHFTSFIELKVVYLDEHVQATFC